MFPSQSWLGVDKQNLTQQKHTFQCAIYKSIYLLTFTLHSPIELNVPQHKHKKLKPGLVASYDIRPAERVYSGFGDS